jgi:hypothetical protein
MKLGEPTHCPESGGGLIQIFTPKQEIENLSAEKGVVPSVLMMANQEGLDEASRERLWRRKPNPLSLPADDALRKAYKGVSYRGGNTRQQHSVGDNHNES